MSRDLIFNPDARCDVCWRKGAYDIYGDFVCPVCLSHSVKKEEEFDAEGISPEEKKIKKIKNKYAPDTCIPPSETILETLCHYCAKKHFFPRGVMEKPPLSWRGDELYQMCKNERPITNRWAGLLESLLNVPESFWLNLEENYQKCRRRLSEK